MNFLKANTSFHSNELVLRLNVNNTWVCFLSQFFEAFFSIYLQFLYIQTMIVFFFFFQPFVSCWMSWGLNKLIFERKITFFEKTLKRVVWGWESSAQDLKIIELWKTNWNWIDINSYQWSDESRIKFILYFYKNICDWIPQPGVLNMIIIAKKL